jgi:hypothetical protein
MFLWQPLNWSHPLSLDIDFQPIADAQDDQRSSYQPPVETPKEAVATEKHSLRAGWRSPHMSSGSLVGFGTVSIVLLVIFVLMSDWRSMFG